MRPIVSAGRSVVADQRQRAALHRGTHLEIPGAGGDPGRAGGAGAVAFLWSLPESAVPLECDSYLRCSFWSWLSHAVALRR